MAAKAKQSKRELIDTGTDKRYVRRDEKGQFDDVVDVGKSLAQDVRHEAKKKVPAGQGDRISPAAGLPEDRILRFREAFCSLNAPFETLELSPSTESMLPCDP